MDNLIIAILIFSIPTVAVIFWFAGLFSGRYSRYAYPKRWKERQKYTYHGTNSQGHIRLSEFEPNPEDMVELPYLKSLIDDSRLKFGKTYSFQTIVKNGSGYVKLTSS